MPREWSWALVAAGACAVGALGAESYARLAAPGLAGATTLLAGSHPWTVREVAVRREGPGGAAVLRMVGEVRRQGADTAPAAVVVCRIAVGEMVQAPLVFWTLLLLWPAQHARERWLRAALGVPVFLAVAIALAACHTLYAFADASAGLAGDPDPLTFAQRVSEFVEAGGGFVLEVVAALLTVAVSQRHGRPRARQHATG